MAIVQFGGKIVHGLVEIIVRLSKEINSTRWRATDLECRAV